MDDRKKRMLIIGGVGLIVVVMLITTAVMINHKNKESTPTKSTPVSTLPTTTTGYTPVSTLPTTTTGYTPVSTLPTTTTIPGTTRAVTTQGVTTTIPVTTRPPLTYIRSTGGLYLICEFGKPLSTTRVLSEATPVTFTKCGNEYCLLFDNKNVKISPGGIGGIIQTDGVYTIYIHSLSETTYLGLLNYTATLALSPFGFGPTSASDANIWNVVVN